MTFEEWLRKVAREEWGFVADPLSVMNPSVIANMRDAWDARQPEVDRLLRFRAATEADIERAFAEAGDNESEWIDATPIGAFALGWRSCERRLRRLAADNRRRTTKRD